MTRLLHVGGAVVLGAVALSQPLRGQMAPDGGRDAYVADLKARRAGLMAALGPDTVLIVWSAPPRVYSADINYPYRQDSNLLYLTGVTEPDAILVLAPGAASSRETLFIRAPSARDELWVGHRPDAREVSEASGIADVRTERTDESVRAFIGELLAGRARLAIPDRLPDGVAPAASQSDAEVHVRWARDMEKSYPGLELMSAASLLATERQIKTPYEQQVLKRSVEISTNAHVVAMKATRPGRWEYEIKAAIEHEFLVHGALSWGYPSIVGSGPNATTLHYLAGTRQMQSGDLLLVDAAGNYQGLTGDITRTYPVNGRFSTAQRTLYQIVLEAEDAGIAAARPGVPPETIVAAVRGVLRDRLAPLGLVAGGSPKDVDEALNLWLPHLPIHGIGVDVHEPIARLDPGTAFVIEPGLYIRADAFDRLPRTPASEALATALGPAASKFAGIGVRVEDSFLMTADGPVMLSAAAPRRVAAIERVVGTGR